MRCMRFAVSAFLLAAVLGSCGQVARTGASSPESDQRLAADGPGLPEGYWDDPIPGSRAVASVDEAAALLRNAFAPRALEGLGQPRSLRVALDSEDPRFGFLVFVYDVEGYGRILVVEKPDEMTVQDFVDQWHQLAGRSDLPGDTESVWIRGGTVEAFLLTNSGGLSEFRWREGKVHFLVRGRTTTRDQMLDLAKQW